MKSSTDVAVSTSSTTAGINKQLDFKKPSDKKSTTIYIEVDYFSCPSLRLAVSILKKNTQDPDKFSEFANEPEKVILSIESIANCLMNLIVIVLKNKPIS